MSNDHYILQAKKKKKLGGLNTLIETVGKVWRTRLGYLAMFWSLKVFTSEKFATALYTAKSSANKFSTGLYTFTLLPTYAYVMSPNYAITYPNFSSTPQ